MHIQGQRIHIAGSASKDTSPNLLKYAHELIFELVKNLAAEGATFIVGVGNEPLSEPNTPASLPIIFDWTALAAVRECLQAGIAQASGSQGRLVATVATSKTEEKIPDTRRELWEFLLAAEAIEIEFLKPGWSSGALRRQQEVPKGDILIILSGGEGVEHLAEEYIASAKPVIPLDLKIGSRCNDGSGGASRLAGEALAQPYRFVRILDSTAAGNLFSRLTTRQGRRPVTEVVEAVVRLIQALEPSSGGDHPQALLHHDSSANPSQAVTEENSSNPQQSILSDVKVGGSISVGSINQYYGFGTAPQPAQPTPTPPPKRTILFLASSPINEARLRLDVEMREIDNGLRLAQQRDRFVIEQRWAVRTDDLRRALLDLNPEIVHFCGHGGGAGGLVLEDNAGQAKLASTEALARLFKLFTNRVRCVVLNACYSQVQADAIRQHIDYVVGMSDAVSDAAAIKFAVGFYDALVRERSYEDAFDFGCNAIEFENLPEELTPVFKKKPT
jgi:hypothetical protein